MNNIENKLNRLIGLVSVISYAGFFLIMLITIADVALRFFFNSPILGTYEIIERIIFCAVFASFAYAQTQGAHIHITMLTSLFPPVLRHLCAALTHLLAAGVVFFMAYAAHVQAQVSLASNYITGVLKLPLYPYYWVEAATMAVFFLVLVLDACKSLLAACRPGPEPA